MATPVSIASLAKMVRELTCPAFHPDNITVERARELNTLEMSFQIVVIAPDRVLKVETLNGVGNMCESEVGDHCCPHERDADCVNPRDVAIVEHRLVRAVYPSISFSDLYGKGESWIFTNGPV